MVSVLNANECEGNVIISMNISVALSFCTTECLSLIKVSHTEHTLLPFSFGALKIITENHTSNWSNSLGRHFSAAKKLCYWLACLFSQCCS